MANKRASKKNTKRGSKPIWVFIVLVPIRGLRIVEIMGFLGFFVEIMGFLGFGPIIAPQDLGFLSLPLSKNHLAFSLN